MKPSTKTNIERLFDTVAELTKQGKLKWRQQLISQKKANAINSTTRCVYVVEYDARRFLAYMDQQYNVPVIGVAVLDPEEPIKRFIEQPYVSQDFTGDWADYLYDVVMESTLYRLPEEEQSKIEPAPNRVSEVILPLILFAIGIAIGFLISQVSSIL